MSTCLISGSAPLNSPGNAVAVENQTASKQTITVANVQANSVDGQSTVFSFPLLTQIDDSQLAIGTWADLVLSFNDPLVSDLGHVELILSDNPTFPNAGGVLFQAVTLSPSLPSGSPSLTLNFPTLGRVTALSSPGGNRYGWIRLGATSLPFNVPNPSITINGTMTLLIV